jgi:transcription-repair coupling factor (superfamily II helicase)
VHHLRELLGHYQLQSELLESPYDPAHRPDKAVVQCYEQPLSRGFDLPEEKTHFLSASELFGEKRLQTGRRKRRSRQEGLPLQIDQLKEGEFVSIVTTASACFRAWSIWIFRQRGDFLLIATGHNNFKCR